MADLLALVCDVYSDFVTFPFGILGQVWYLIVSIPDPSCRPYLIKKVCCFYAKYNGYIFYIYIKMISSV